MVLRIKLLYDESVIILLLSGEEDRARRKREEALRGRSRLSLSTSSIIFSSILLASEDRLLEQSSLPERSGSREYDAFTHPVDRRDCRKPRSRRRMLWIAARRVSASLRVIVVQFNSISVVWSRDSSFEISDCSFATVCSLDSSCNLKASMSTCLFNKVKIMDSKANGVHK